MDEGFAIKDKHDIEGVERIFALGYPAYRPYIPLLLSWLQDINWPIALPICLKLRGLGAEILPYLREIISGDDYIWQYWLILYLVAYLEPDVRQALKADVEASIARNPNLAQEEGLVEAWAEISAISS